MPHHSLSESVSTLNRETEEQEEYHDSGEVSHEQYNTSELSKVKLVAKKNDKQRLSNKLCFREVVNYTEPNNNSNNNKIIRNDQESAAFSATTTRYVSIDNGTDITELVEQQCRYYVNSTRTHNIAFTTECGPILLGRVSTSVAFALSAIFSVGVFCAVNY